MNKTEIHHAALSFLAKHESSHLHHDERRLLIDRCMQHLTDTFDTSRDTAEVVTLQAFGEHESRTCRAFVDMTLTTSFTVFVRDPDSGLMRVFPVSGLLALCRPALSSLPVPSAKDLLANGIPGDRTPL
jgi:hypothetical protein